MTDTKVMVLPDGRELAWLELGPPQGSPVFAFHGTPGSRLQLAFGEPAAYAAGARLITPDRPGYGHSSFQKGRRLIDWAGDVTALADHLDIERFSVIGVSGGGPYAAVCACFGVDRVVGTGIVSGIGPLTMPRAGRGMTALNQMFTFLARTWSTPMYLALTLGLEAYRLLPGQMRHLHERRIPEPDAEVIRRPELREFRQAMLEEFRRAPSSTARATAEEFALFAKDWGFRLEDITTPVHFWHGDRDRNVPISHGWAQAELIKGAIFHECPGEAHMLYIDHLEEILTTVTNSTK